jgi:HSP20 family protein
MREFQVVLPSAEVGDLADEIERVFDELDRTLGLRPPGECRPPLDVVETDEAFEIAMDLPGVMPQAVRVLLKGGMVLIAGHKPRSAEDPAMASDFHLVERVFGRFARVVHLRGAFDGARSKVTLHAGELRIVLPRIHERRGRRFVVPISWEDAPS